MKIYNIFLLAFPINFLQVSSAQQTGRMETDRPDQTESPFIVKNKYEQNEVLFKTLFEIVAVVLVILPAVPVVTSDSAGVITMSSM